MNLWDIFTIVATSIGIFFFAAGALGLLRFPDVFSRLHALTKADNLGLGLVVVGIIPQVASIFDALQLVITWVFVMIAGAVCSFLIANYALTRLGNGVSTRQMSVNNKPERGIKDEY